jgi:CheY-like chemotaxis protein
MLTREIRKLQDEKPLPIILLTSLGRRETWRRRSGLLRLPDQAPQTLGSLRRPGWHLCPGAASPRKPETASQPGVMDHGDGKGTPAAHPAGRGQPVNQKLALRILEQMGYRADVASNGLEAVQSIERQTYDVILMDVQMPEMDGLDATRHIRKLTDDATQPHIIAMTANALEGDREMCIAAGWTITSANPSASMSWWRRCLRWRGKYNRHSRSAATKQSPD